MAGRPRTISWMRSGWLDWAEWIRNCFIRFGTGRGRPRRTGPSYGSSRAVGAYVGLQPRRSQSGDRDPELRITKAEDDNLRRLLIGSVHYILGPFGPDTDLRRWGLALATTLRSILPAVCVVPGLGVEPR